MNATVAGSGDAQRLRIASVCRLLPTPADASAGTFILNRLSAMAQLAHVSVLQPIPFFPGIAPQPQWARTPVRTLGSLSVTHAPMFYVPKVFKGLDGRWLGRSIRAELMKLRRTQSLDLIDAHFGYPEGVGCALVARELGIPYFITIRGLETDVLQRPGVREQLLQALQHATGLISVSHSLKALMIDNGIDQAKILVAPNAVDRKTFSPGDRATARAKLTIAADSPLIVCVGHLLSVKRHTVLLDALALVRAKIPAARLVIIGGPSYEAHYPAVLNEQVVKLGLGDAVRFAGKLPPAQVADWLRAADVFSLASAREGCCNAVLEALACGVPVIATRVGDNPHFVEEGVNGHLAPPDDAPALARALELGLSRQWNAAHISSRLSVGTWADTATRVLDFMRAGVGSNLRSAA